MRLPAIFRRSSMVINVTAVALIGLLIWAGWAEIDQWLEQYGLIVISRGCEPKAGLSQASIMAR
jgi:hypothetical protein